MPKPVQIFLSVIGLLALTLSITPRFVPILLDSANPSVNTQVIDLPARRPFAFRKVAVATTKPHPIESARNVLKSLYGRFRPGLNPEPTRETKKSL